MANIDGTAGDDNLIGTPDADTINGFAGNDVLRGRAGNDTLNGDEDHDFLIGGDDNDTLNGGNGDDYLRGGEGDDVVDGGAGFDRAAFTVLVNNPGIGETGVQTGATVNLNIQGVAQNTGHGMDTLIDIEHVSGTAYDDTLIGNGGDNWIWGEGGNDNLQGGGGNDLVETDAGNSVLDGGAGIDTAGFNGLDSFTSGVTVSLALQGSAQIVAAGSSITLNNFENLTGTSHDDSLAGDSADNVIAGNVGNDTLLGGGGNDTLYGDGRIAPDTHGIGGSGPITIDPDAAVTFSLTPGNDLLEGGLGDDHLNGGGGTDTASYANASGGVSVNLGSGFAFGADGSDTLANIENVTGSEFDDQIVGNGGDNVLAGLGGHDFILGQAGNDTVDGGTGDDTIRGGTGDDTLLGGDGDDHMRGNAGVDSYDGGSDTGTEGGAGGFGDRVSFYDVAATQGAVADLRTGVVSNDGFGNVETMTNMESLGAGTAFADTFYGNDGRNFLFGNHTDSIYGFGGDDILYVDSATAIADGGAGTDVLRLVTVGGWLQPDADADGLAEIAPEATSGWTVNLAAGTLIDGYGNAGTVIGVENVDGSALDDNITGDANANVLSGLDGNDTLEGGDGNDTLDGGGGTDTASYAGAGGDVQVTLNAAGGSASGAAGSDTLVSIENVTGSAHNDGLTGNDADNILAGGDGHDFLRGRGGNDILLGGNGDDFMRGDAGDDVMDGGAGWDRVSYATGATTGVTVNLTIVGAQATGAGMDTLIGVEQLSGTIFDDVLTGDGGDNWLWGGSQGTGVTGNDTISAGGGNDLVEVGTGTHTLDGGTGTDTLSLYGGSTDITAAGVTFSLALQGAAQDTEQGLMNAAGFENVSGSIYGDLLTGNNGANILLGDLGNDTLSGGDGDDTLYGDGRMLVDTSHGGPTGPITLFGDAAAEFGDPGGNDTLIGGKGNDTLYGGLGDDVLTGNQGGDNFVIEAASGDDVITDFGNLDQIIFDALSGVDDFTDLLLAASGSHDTMISWGTTDSLLVQGVKPNQLDASDFAFGASSPSTSAMADALSIGSSFGHPMDQGAQMAMDMAANGFHAV